MPIGTTATDTMGNYNDLLTTTDGYWVRKELVNNIFQFCPTLQHFQAAGRIKKAPGGEHIKVGLMYAMSTAGGAYEGTDTINIDPQEGAVPALWLWKEYGFSIVYSQREFDMNQGEAALIGLIDRKRQQARLSMEDTIATDFFAGNGANAKKIRGLAQLVSATGTYGGISKDVYSWWQSQSETATGMAPHATDTTKLGDGLNKMRNLYNDCSLAAGPKWHPDVIAMDQSGHEAYEARTEIRLQVTQKAVADLGFPEGIRFKAATMYLDPYCTATKGYFLCTKCIFLIVHSNRNWKLFPYVSPANQTVSVGKIGIMFNLAANNLRKQGILNGTDTVAA